jgi:hypothetical protein
MEDGTGISRGGEKSTGRQVTYPKKRAAIAVSNYYKLNGPDILKHFKDR